MRKMKFGIELEVATSKSKQEVINALSNAGINVEGSYYGSGVREGIWKVQPDSSINGWEIVSPPLTDTKDLEVVCHVLRKVVKARSSKKCGLHIHHDINDFNLEQIKNIYKLYAKYEMNAIHSIQSPHRHNNMYCNPVSPYINRVLSSDTIEEFKYCIGSRYLNLNHRSYAKFGTIEFRGAQGTVEIDRILAWLDLTHKLVELAEDKEEVKKLHAGRTKEEALEIMFEELNMEESSRKHYRKVQRYFAKLA